MYRQYSIEDGYFVFTMMPSLRCDLNCPHCYLTLEQRRYSPVMTLEQLETAFEKVALYYSSRNIESKTIVFYWYGGEPTQMGQDYFLAAFKLIRRYFPVDDGYKVINDILTSLINVDDSWFDIFHEHCAGHVQTSFDGVMRGKGYVKQWEKKVVAAKAAGLSVSTISVVNNTFLESGTEGVLNYLTELGVSEASFLPFMLNEQNKGKRYESFAPRMEIYSEFMIQVTKNWLELVSRGLSPPEIGQIHYSITRKHMPGRANIPAQTLFLLPNGDFVLPDYRDGYVEYMNPFGNIFQQSFEEILSSLGRRHYLRKQYQRNMNSECIRCEAKDYCIMEFWKDNRDGDECFGAKKFVEFASNEANLVKHVLNSESLIF